MDEKPAAEALNKKLSDREAEILRCRTKGDSNKEIARKLAITEATVRVHLKAILRKIGCLGIGLYAEAFLGAGSGAQVPDRLLSRILGYA